MMYGITGGVHSWVKSFLYARTQRVRVGKKPSSSADVLSGIPQGSILGPVLFTIFINDIADNINSFCRIFADDTKIFNITKNSISSQEDLAKLQEWSFKWGLHFNVNKCHVCICVCVCVFVHVCVRVSERERVSIRACLQGGMLPSTA